MKKNAKKFTLYMVIVVAVFIAILMLDFSKRLPATVEHNYGDLLGMLERGEVISLNIKRDSDFTNSGTAKAVIIDKESELENKEVEFSVEILDMDGFMEVANKAHREFGMKLDTSLPPKTGLFFALLPIGVTILLVFVFFFFIQQMQGGGGGNKVMSFGKSKAKAIVDDKNKITFNLVAGLEEEKEELAEIVDFLKTPKKYTDIGAKIPKGVLLVGPPGTGKTYLAKAVAGEAGVPFFSISGSDFVEMFVGVGASRVRDLFDQAKKNAPCIIFIDEIDAVGRRRGAGLGGGHDEREQTLNQLLVEMDGFAANEGVIILAATNRADILDPALLRPGRFDRRVSVGIPDVKGREGVLKVHAKGKKMASDVDLKVVAQTTAGFTPADLENLLNESALLAARENKKEISMVDINAAFIKMGIGTEKKSHVVSEKGRKITAYHEAGHAILHEVLVEPDPVHILSIIPTGWAGGYTMPLPDDTNTFMTKTAMEQKIITLLGGRAAEALVLKDITAGASNDIERATNLARKMVAEWGMSEVVGLLKLDTDENEVFLGRDIGNSRSYGAQTRANIDSEVKRIVDESYAEALKLLEQYMDVMHDCANLLLEKEKISGDEFRALFKTPLPEKNRMAVHESMKPIIEPRKKPSTTDFDRVLEETKKEIEDLKSETQPKKDSDDDDLLDGNIKE